MMEANLRIISWNVRGLNCPLKRGSVRWVLRRYTCDVAILLETKLQEVDRRMVCSLWGRRRVKWVYLSSSGWSGGIIIHIDPETLELLDGRTGDYSVCCLLRSVHDNFIWGLIGVYGPNNDTLRDGFGRS